MRNALPDVGRRERQIMDTLYRRGRATAAEVLQDLPDPPSYSAVRSMLRLLEEKGLVTHDWDGPRHVFRPTADTRQVQRSAAQHLLRTFFNNSMESAVAAMLGVTERPLTTEELDRLAKLIEQARRKGGRPPTEWDDREGTPRRYVRASGTVGRGRGLVSIKTMNGDIEVRRGR